MTKIGLRVDVDTFRGTAVGTPQLCELLASHDIKASFFFSVGPDNMGRHLWRLLKPAFLWKMLRTNAASLYGLDILFKGTFWPGPDIGKNLAHVITGCENAGHEIGLHAWDHHAWQAKIDSWTPEAVHKHIKLGFDRLTDVLGHPPACSAVPGWKCTGPVLEAKEQFPFKYNSDCRGEGVFMPKLNGTLLTQPQLPVSLPTYDEVLGKDNITNDNYNQFMLSQLKPDTYNVLTIHAEAEGISCNTMFNEFVKQAKDMDYEFVPLIDLIGEVSSSLPPARIVQKEFPGREGWIACRERQE